MDRTRWELATLAGRLRTLEAERDDWRSPARDAERDRDRQPRPGAGAAAQPLVPGRPGARLAGPAAGPDPVAPVGDGRRGAGRRGRATGGQPPAAAPCRPTSTSRSG